ncbi:MULTISPECIES: alpha,alpha-trehalase TreA [unclassified Mucilaginibacter]|uniref:alpha,alpha-trehalase TreA n=1 Tax=unclassified Mucilaginibacter TaxID=2617802 RepID=UPI002AC96841|nr:MULTISPECIES: alpha,alpha-trehalase TreA [unclassified Mucilaginibacter]MEB0263041.1 alpha,alpha-trehalase TreA [Mucilaginibacter sp. 10I4]MEB0277913.1 alpha,alpha-trehalase TreA [Mucilaginibacter sp. 10B2]MEB0301997.1 alpha,alpha-trehalase TreA [Mucilaginibacter sp. 5C4]WPX22804.1 alpha,alpha-trehalase TreA [Mucilaginibacter sp. 5C4]
MKKTFIVAALLLCTFVVKAQQKTPRQLFPDLFESVQSSTIFPDNKTFVDCTPKYAPSQIMKAYNEQLGKAGFDLKEFVMANFTVPSGVTHAFQTNIEDGIRKHIDTLWQVLQRKPDATSKLSSLAALPKPYIVPGGRFREIYYWDSYFTMLGLQESKQTKVISNMIDNFAYLIDTYGFIPNGNRAYYLTRSQPPFFSLMVNLLAKSEGNTILSKYQPQLIKEYNYWMLGGATLTNNKATHRAVRMADGTLLNRYWDESDEPREESYIKDVDAAKTTKQPLPVFYHNVRAAAASGWDFSSRWFSDATTLGTIETTNLVPVDLNCLLYNLELTIAHSYQIKGNTKLYTAYTAIANARKKAILKYFWDEKTGWFGDYNFTTQKFSPIPTLAAVFPLEFKIATPAQANKIADGLKANFLKPGGLVTTLNFSGQQWDAPNGWAPLQYMAIDGLENYGHSELAKDIATRWLQLNIRVFKKTGKLLEKYNVVDTSLTAGGGEYPLQDGFGWTNGVLLKLMNRYHYEEKQGE